MLLILFGLLLFVLEIKVTSFGLLTVGGLVSLVFGSMILMDSPLPELQLSLRVVLPVVLGFAAIAVFLVRLAVAAQRQPPVTGQAAMVGEPGEALTAIAAWTHRARSPRTARSGTRPRQSRSPKARASMITEVDGLTLVVRRD